MGTDENHWTFEASCRNEWEIFDLQYDESDKEYYPHFKRARSICLACPVFDECKIAGKDEGSGIWAGEIKGGK